MVGSLNLEHGDSPLAAAIHQRDAGVLNIVRKALKQRNVMLAYQPVVQAGDTAKPAFYEGLIRVLDDTRRVVPAREFIDAIEPLEEGRMIDCLALELGLQTLRDNPSLRLSINMSARSIGYPQWEKIFNEGLAMDATISERLILEITEASAMQMPDLVVNFMEKAHLRGVSFALDDFGAGYTAFRYFKEFFFDMVKIDRSFISGIEQDSDNQVLTDALVLIARQFDMFTIAEGVEHPTEAQYLKDAGVDCLQGYLFGAPQLTLAKPQMAPRAKSA